MNPNSGRESEIDNKNQNNVHFDCDNDGFEKKPKPLTFNNDYKLPFFAYGIFKPRQLAFSRIEKFIDYEKTSKRSRDIHYKMITRDGVPLIEDKEDKRYYTQGYLIYFKKGHEKRAYDIISNTQRRALYNWKEIEVDGIKSNVLVGLHLERGIPGNEFAIDVFRGERDPLFSFAMKKIGKTVKEIENGKKTIPNIQNFFNIQQNYMLLWSAIERYASLKYDINKDERVQLAREYSDIFKNVIEEHVDEERVVYNSETLWCNRLDPDNSVGSMFYYYTVRCNIVHNGKEFQFRDFDLLLESLVELYKIFKQVLEKTFSNKKTI